MSSSFIGFLMMSNTSETLLAADGTPLRKKLAQALFQSKLRAFGLAVPLLAFVIVSFIVPILILLWQGIYDDDYATDMPNISQVLEEWDGYEAVSEKMYEALVRDFIVAMSIDRALTTRAGVRVNREISGAISLHKKLMRSVGKLKLSYDGKEQKAKSIFRALAKEDKNRNYILSPAERSEIGKELATDAVKKYAPFEQLVLKSSKKWSNIEIWRAMKVASRTYSPAYLAASLDYNYTFDGKFEKRDEDRQIHILLFFRTLEISLVVTIACLLLGYPVAYLLAGLPVRSANLLLILVLLPFWTSLLVRTTAWIAMLQGQGVLNDLFVVFGFATDDDRFSLIYNKTGTLIAMTHILLPFMILPLYSVMKTIPPSYVRAARSMGATNWTSFWRIYFPQSVPGIGAGALLVFILAIGYFITPALVGGQDGIMISNMIDFHMRKSLNWNLAAALGLVLLVFVLFLYWLYDRIVGIDNMKLG